MPASQPFVPARTAAGGASASCASGAYPVAPLPAPAADGFADAVFRKRHLRRVSALAGAPDAFIAAWTAWLDAPSEAALSPLASAHGAEPVARACVLLAADLLRERGPDDAAARFASSLPARLAVRLLADHLDRPASEDDACLRDLGLTHAYLAEQLRVRPVDEAVLQTTRFLVEIVGPHLVEGPAAWEKNIAAAHLALESGCPALARPLLARWAGHLRALGPRLVALQHFLCLAFPAGHTALAPELAAEKTLRGALTAALLPYLLSAEAPWPGEALRALAPASAPEPLVAFLDTLFDQLDGADYYDLLAILSAPPPPLAAPASATPAASAGLRAALAAPLPKKGLLGAFFGPPPEQLAHDLALVALLSPPWLAPVLPELAPAEHRPLAVGQVRAWSDLAPA